MGDEAAVTELAGIAQAPTESVQAWALDYDDYEPTTRFTARRITDAALAGCLVLMAAAGVVAVLVIRGVWNQPAPMIAAPTTTVTTVPPTPKAQPTPGPWFTPTKPATVTVTPPAQTVAAPPPAGITVEQLAAYDRQFVANLQARGLTVWDTTAVAKTGHRVCAALSNGVSPDEVAQQLISPTATFGDAQVFVTTATLTYPNCP